MNTVRVSGQEWMPVREAASLREAAVCTGPRHPGEIFEIRRLQYDTIRHMLEARRVIRAAATFRIQKPAGNIRVVDISGVFIFELVKAAATATVAERFPFRLRHLVERFALPEWCFRVLLSVFRAL